VSRATRRPPDCAGSPDGDNFIAGPSSTLPRERDPLNQRTIVAAVLATLLLTACADGSVEAAADADERLEQRQSEFFAALGARDADRMAELFAEDGVLHIAGMPAIEGRGAIRQFYGNMFGFLSASDATPVATRLSGSGDMAYSIGAMSNEFRGPDGPARYGGKYLLVWENRADWVIAVYSISSDQPDAGR
jgi:ketosteroid isomerase-like protein